MMHGVDPAPHGIYDRRRRARPRRPHPRSRRSRAGVPWVNVAPLRMDQQLGRPVLIEFWDFCRPNSLRTLPYLKAWHERYAGAGLRVIGVHASGLCALGRPGGRDGRGGAARDRLSGGGRRRVRALAGVRQPRLAGPLPVRPAGAPVRVPLRRGRLRRDRAGDPGAAGRRAPAARAGAPRGRARRASSSPRARTSTGPTAGPTRPAACGRCSTARARVDRRRRASRVARRPPRRLRADRAPAQHRRRARARGRRRRALPRGLLHPGAGATARTAARRSAVEQVDQLGRPGRPRRQHARTRPGTGCAPGRGPRKPARWTQQPRVDQPRAGGGRATRARSSPGSGPARWVWPKTT